MTGRRELTDRILSIAGIVVAACALMITFYQVHLMRTQAAIAVWPHIEQYDTMANSGFSRVVYNAGLGPAIIRYLGIKVDGRTQHQWRATALALIQQPSSLRQFKQSDLPPGFVLLQGEKIPLMEFLGQEAKVAQNRAHLLETRICYCSLYGTCWMSSYRATVNRRVDHCPDATTTGFYAEDKSGSPGNN